MFPQRLRRVAAGALLAAAWLLPAAHGSTATLDLAAGGVRPPSSVAEIPAPPETLKNALNAQVQAARQIARQLGVHVIDLRSGATIYSYEADQLRILASNTKLLTSAAALDRLGPGYFFETRLLLRGTVTDGVLQGDLAITGGGDPNISGRHSYGDPYAAFRPWAAALRQRGIHRVEGKTYLVHGLFDDGLIHPDWPRDQLTRWYEAPVSALSFNDNCVVVRVWPGGHAGAPAQVQTVPRLPGLFQLRSSVRTSASARGTGVWVRRDPGSSVIQVGGAVYRGSQPVEVTLTVPDPVAYFGAALRAALAEEGVELATEPVASRRYPVGVWETIAVHRSDLLTTLEVQNKKSQNFYAESVLKTLGAEACRRGDWAGGTEAVRELLDRLGLPRNSYQLTDGSGMSRGNRFTPRQMTTLLRFMFYHPWGNEFVRTLPYSGEPDLSWERRLATAPYRGNVFAKTGTLNGVSTLSGYARGLSGRLYAFSILGNQTRSTWQARQSQDRILRALIDQG